MTFLLISVPWHRKGWETLTGSTVVSVLAVSATCRVIAFRYHWLSYNIQRVTLEMSNLWIGQSGSEKLGRGVTMSFKATECFSVPSTIAWMITRTGNRMNFQLEKVNSSDKLRETSSKRSVWSATWRHQAAQLQIIQLLDQLIFFNVLFYLCLKELNITFRAVNVLPTTNSYKRKK